MTTIRVTRSPAAPRAHPSAAAGPGRDGAVRLSLVDPPVPRPAPASPEEPARSR